MSDDRKHALKSKAETPLQISRELYQYVMAHSREEEINKKCREETFNNKEINAVCFYCAGCIGLCLANVFERCGVFVGCSSCR